MQTCEQMNAVRDRIVFSFHVLRTAGVEESKFLLRATYEVLSYY